jgi:signal transduction histidine kinase
VVQRGENLVISGATQPPDFEDIDDVEALQNPSLICVPLKAHGKVIGALYLESQSEEHAFSHDDLESLELFASHAAVAIESVSLQADLESHLVVCKTRLEQAMGRLERNWQEAVEFNRVRSEFLSKVAHDIRSPLTTALMAQQMLNSGNLGELSAEQQEWVRNSLQLLQHVFRLTEDFFELTRVQMGGLLIFPDWVNLGEYLRQVFQVVQFIPRPERVRLELDLANGLPELCLDETRIQQVIVNLVDNATKFTETGEILLYAHPTKDRDGVVIGVRDTGFGIAPGDMGLIFERFHQSGPMEARERGVGLGLAICKEIVELHGGRIWAVSEVGKGSDFKFLLPLEQPDA